MEDLLPLPLPNNVRDAVVDRNWLIGAAVESSTGGGVVGACGLTAAVLAAAEACEASRDSGRDCRPVVGG